MAYFRILYSQNGYTDPRRIFSREFCEEFTRRTGRPLLYCENLRYDSDIIDLVALRGPQWSAATGNELAINVVPNHFRSFFPVLHQADVAVDHLVNSMNFSLKTS
jgi:hypothetical protein